VGLMHVNVGAVQSISKPAESTQSQRTVAESTFKVGTTEHALVCQNP